MASSLLGSVSAFAMGGAAPSSCEISKHQQAIASIVSRLVPRGSNGRGSAASVLHLASNSKVLDVGFEKNANVFQPVASTQKILTAWVVARFASSMSSSVRFSDSDLYYDNEGSRAYDRSTNRTINVGDSATLNSYLYTLMTQSSNGAAHALARGTSKTTENFVAQMNSEAVRLLGSQRRSYFQNPSGLTDDSDIYRFAESDSRQGSTAREMAMLAGIVMNDSKYKSRLSSAGVAYIGDGYLYKLGSTDAAGRTVVMRFPHQGEGCGGQSIAVALFGENSSTQSANFLRAYEELKALLR